LIHIGKGKRVDRLIKRDTLAQISTDRRRGIAEPSIGAGQGPAAHFGIAVGDTAENPATVMESFMSRNRPAKKS
jgi:hypothetical protein